MLQSLAVERDDRPNELLRPLASSRVSRAETGEQLLEPPRHRIDGGAHVVTRLSEWRQRRVNRLDALAFPQIHVHAAWEAGIEAAHRAHDVDALEVLWSVLFVNRRVLHGVLVGTRRPVDVA